MSQNINVDSEKNLVTKVRSVLNEELKKELPKRGLSRQKRILLELKREIVALKNKGHSLSYIHRIIKDETPYIGSYQTLRTLVISWEALGNDQAIKAQKKIRKENTMSNDVNLSKNSNNSNNFVDKKSAYDDNEDIV